MVILRRPLDGWKHVICPFENLFGHPPARTEQKQIRLAPVAAELSQLPIGNGILPLPGTGHHNPWRPSINLRHILQHSVEARDHPHLVEGGLPLGVIGCSPSFLPVPYYPLREFLLLRDRCHHVVAVKTEG